MMAWVAHLRKVEQRVTPSGDNLIHLQQYDGLGREWRNWNPIYSSSAFLNPSDVSSLSQSQYDDSHAFSQNNYESNSLNRVVEVEGIGEDWKGHSIKSDHLINTSSFPLNCKYYRVSMSGELQDKGYYPEGRLYVTKTTDEDGHESYEFKNLAGHVILQRVMLGGTESADTYYIYDYRGNLSFNIMGKDVVLHDYNVRNWPLSIESDNFKENLCYNQSNGSLYPRTSLFSGNISAQSWQCGNEVKHGYHFTYNSQSMLTDSEYSEGDRLNDGRGNYDESLSYDKMGNVQSLLRSGLLDDGSYGLIDNLSYNYHGNQLLKVDDAAVGPYYQGAFHFVDGADEAVEYEYDANGNLVRDLNKGIISISYDLNNQPRKIEYNDGRNVSYLSDAEGSKLSVSYNLTAMSSAQPQMPVMQSSDVASANVSNGQKTIDYCGNIIYDGDETMILNDVGYALCNKDNNLSFHYYLKDHLGNNRVVVSENGEIEQVNDYYPTGALMASSKGGDTQRFKFNGKELDRTNGLNWYDYGARNYDAAIVRWDGMDKLCEKYSPFTPYGYCKNNFVNAYDKDGNDVFVLLAPNGAGGCGHMAILIQNNDKTWSLWSKNGTPEHSHAYGKEGKRGSPYHNNRGGSIKGQPTSYKNILEFFKSSDNPIVDGVPEYTEGFLIKTTTKQDEKVKNGISKELNKDYNVLSSNCAQAVQEGLKNAGLNYGKGILPKKQVYPSITRVSIIS